MCSAEPSSLPFIARAMWLFKILIRPDDAHTLSASPRQRRTRLGIHLPRFTFEVPEKLEDVSDVLVCYALGMYKTQSNPQANRVIA